jgi:hypothetical protein
VGAARAYELATRNVELVQDYRLMSANSIGRIARSSFALI